MKISINWIRDFVDLTNVDIQSLINKFTLSVAEVEDVIYYGNDVNNVVVAKIIEVNDHPNSKKLHLLKVDCGTEIVDVVCGAPNVRVGLTTAFAKIGANVIGMSIQKAEIAGYLSCGMCCSEKELGISEDNSGIMELDDDLQAGVDIKSIFSIDDIVVEVDNKSLTHRPDLWGHYGIAREISALLDRPLKPLEIYDYSAKDLSDDLQINIEDTDNCFRYTAARLGNISRRVSPLNMRIRLFYCGTRAINFLSDLTNYIMQELGQPMHAFDSEKIKNIRVKTFKEPINFITLDNKERTVEPNTLMICNDLQPVAIAGIMGGANSEITDNTTSVMIESANFNGITTRKSSTILNLRTAASVRYEKILDPELTMTALLRFVYLLIKYDNKSKFITQIIDKYPHKFDKVSLKIDKAYIEKYIGTSMYIEQVVKILTSLEFEVTQKGDNLQVDVPSFRSTKDVTIKADLIEEIARIYGYNNIPVATISSTVFAVRQDSSRELQYKVKRLLSGTFAMSEVHSYIWYDKKANNEIGIKTNENVSIINAISPDFTTVRASMGPSIINIINENKQTHGDISIYEIGRVVKGLNSENNCNEQRVLSLALAGKTISERDVYHKMLSIVNTLTVNVKNAECIFNDRNCENDYNWVHNKNSVNVLCGGVEIGYISVVHPLIKNNIDKKLNLVIAELNFDLLSSMPDKVKKFSAITKFPNIEIDYTFIVNKNVLYGDIANIINAQSFEYLKSINFVDVYTDKNDFEKYSLTIKLIFESLDKTLVTSEISEFTTKIIEKLAAKNIMLKL